MAGESEYIIETGLTDEERALIEDSVKRYHYAPSSFITLKELKRRLGYVPLEIAAVVNKKL